MGKSVTFHIFPDKDKKRDKWEKWVQAMKRVNPDGSAWAPGSKWVYVCSEHFQTGDKILIAILYSLVYISCIIVNYK